MTDQPGDYYVAEAVAWIDSVEGLSDADRVRGREVFAVLLAHHDVYLHAGRVSYEECLERARREFTPAEPTEAELRAELRAMGVDVDRLLAKVGWTVAEARRLAALEKLKALPAFEGSILATRIPPGEKQ